MIEDNKFHLPAPRPQDQISSAPPDEQSEKTRPCTEPIKDLDIESSAPSYSKTKSSLDLTQRLERKLAEYNASENLFKRWLFEISSWLVAAVCMGAIVGIYVHVDARDMVDCETLLTLVNILGKVASAALIVPTSEALGQLKWNWFNKSNAMWDFEIFDKASRGAWGATLLLFRTKGRSLAALGAILIVLLLAIDTFFQQVVTFPDRWQLQDERGHIPRVVNYKPPYLKEYQDGLEMSVQDINFKSAVNLFFYNNGTVPVPYGNGTRPEIPLSCPTSNCTWPAYETLAVCSKCADATPQIDVTFACRNASIDWSAYWLGPPAANVCGHWLNLTSDEPLLLSGYILNNSTDNSSDSGTGEVLLGRKIPLTTLLEKDLLYATGSINFKDVRSPIFDALLVSSPGGRSSVLAHDPPHVQECVLHWCVQTMKSSYAYGTYKEEILSAYYNDTERLSPWEVWWIYSDIDGSNYTFTVFDEEIQIERPPMNSSLADGVIHSPRYGMDNFTASNSLYVFDTWLPSAYSLDNSTDLARLRYNELFGPAIKYNTSDVWNMPALVPHFVERMAIAMTNVMRSSQDVEMVNGNSYSREKFVAVQWEWLIFPFVLLLLSFLFLAATIIKTSKDTAYWKTSAMPTLIYSLPKDTQTQLTKSSTWHTTKGGKKIRIKLQPDNGWRVSGISQLVASPKLPPPAASKAPRGWI